MGFHLEHKWIISNIIKVPSSRVIKTIINLDNDNRRESELKISNNPHPIKVVPIITTTLVTKSTRHFKGQDSLVDKGKDYHNNTPNFVEKKMSRGKVLQKCINQLSTRYYFVSCDNNTIGIRTIIK